MYMSVHLTTINSLKAVNNDALCVISLLTHKT